MLNGTMSQGFPLSPVSQPFAPWPSPYSSLDPNTQEMGYVECGHNTEAVHLAPTLSSFQQAVQA